MPSMLSAHEQPISKIFSNDYVFQIPPFQRPYAWTVQEATDLIEDLLGALEPAPMAVNEMQPYFLGSIVLIKSERSPQSDVVDGQQRLTTLTILLAALRNNLPPERAVAITTLLYEQGEEILGTQDRYRLSLRSRDEEFFRKYIQNNTGFSALLDLAVQPTDSRENIRNNAIYFDSRLGEISEIDRVRLAQFIVTRCFLVIVATPDLDSAYRIFSVLNSRGLDLGPTDILKAKIIGQIPGDLRGKYTEKWEDAEEDLGRTSFSELFSHIRMIHRKAKPKGTVLKEFDDHVMRGRAPDTIIDQIILPTAEVYQQILDTSYTSVARAEIINDYFKWLNKVEFKDWVPPALAFAAQWRGHPDKMETFFRDLERLTYVLVLNQTGINNRIDRFSGLTKEIESNSDLSRPDSLLQITHKEQVSALAILRGDFYAELSAKARLAVMLRLDSLLSGGGANYDYDTVTIEHVLPQNPPPGSEWSEWFSSEKARHHYVHQLGNLALLTRKKNSSAKNYDFNKKKNAYFLKNGVTPFVITSQIVGQTEWTPTVVDARQNQIVSLLTQHWRLQSSPSIDMI